MTDLWLFVEWRPGTWTRALIPAGVQTVQDLIAHIQRGGKIISEWIDLPEHAKIKAHQIGKSATVLATLQ